MAARRARPSAIVDDGEDEDLERHYVDLRPAGDDLEAAAVGARACGDEVALEMEDAQEVDEVGADEAQAAQVGELVGLEVQRAERVQFAVQLGDELGERIRRRVAAQERVLGLRRRVPMQHRLPHRELVEVGVEQAGDDGLHRRFRRAPHDSNSAKVR